MNHANLFARLIMPLTGPPPDRRPPRGVAAAA